MKYIKMNIAGVYFEPNTSIPIIILKDTNGNNKVLPIWIGPMEASSIILQLKNITPPRPITHDLFVKFFKQNGIKISKILINDFRNNTFFSLIYYRKYFFTKKIDARPSDAISIALRIGAPIYVKNSIIGRTFKSIINSVNKKQHNTEYYKRIFEEFDNSELSKTIM